MVAIVATSRSTMVRRDDHMTDMVLPDLYPVEKGLAALNSSLKRLTQKSGATYVEVQGHVRGGVLVDC